MRRNDLKNPKRSSNTGHVVTKERSGETNYRKRRGKRLGYCWFRACSLEETRHRAFNGVSRTISYLRKQRCKWGVARFSFRFVSFRGWKKHGSPFPPRMVKRRERVAGTRAPSLLLLPLFRESKNRVTIAQLLRPPLFSFFSFLLTTLTIFLSSRIVRSN